MSAELYIQLQTLAGEQAEVAAAMETAPERLGPLYQIALGAISARLQESLATKEASTLLGEQQASLDSDIDTVEAFVAKGYLDSGTAASEMERIMRHPDYRLLFLATRLGATGLGPKVLPEIAADPIQDVSHADAVQGQPPVRPDAPPVPTPEVPADEDMVAANGFAVLDNEFGQFKKPKLAILQTIALLPPGHQVTPYELWKSGFPDTPFDKYMFNKVRTWIEENVTNADDGQVPLRHNGMRGKGSRYVVTRAPRAAAESAGRYKDEPEAAPALGGEFLNAPTDEEMELMAWVIAEIVDIHDGTLEADLVAGSELDLSIMTDDERKSLYARSLFKIKKIGTCDETRQAMYRDARKKAEHVIKFLDAVTPILKEYMPGTDDEMLEYVATEAMSKHAASAPTR